jgi:hypothetical protein
MLHVDFIALAALNRDTFLPVWFNLLRFNFPPLVARSENYSLQIPRPLAAGRFISIFHFLEN